MTQEEWRPIPGHSAYEASSLGRIRSIPRATVRSDGVTRRFPAKVLAPSLFAGKYQKVSFSESGRVTTHSVHVLVALAFHGPRPAGLHVCHGRRGSLDNRPSNLRYGTPADNARDTVEHGMHFRTWRTHCPRGHALEEPNLVRAHLRAGRRNCRACDQASTHIRRLQARGGRPPTLQEESDVRYREIVGAGQPLGK